MVNGRKHQLELAIEEATEEVARLGWANSSERALTLAGFGYIAHIVKPKQGSGKPALAGAFVFGGAFTAGLLRAILMFL